MIVGVVLVAMFLVSASGILVANALVLVLRLRFEDELSTDAAEVLSRDRAVWSGLMRDASKGVLEAAMGAGRAQGLGSRDASGETRLAAGNFTAKSPFTSALGMPWGAPTLQNGVNAGGACHE